MNLITSSKYIMNLMEAKDGVKTVNAYLDNAATTKPFASVVDIMNKTMTEDFGNPSSMHLIGVKAENYIKEAKEILAASLKVDTKELYFTSGGTESNNMAIIGTVLANRRAGNHIITTKIEHPSVHNPLLFLSEFGFEVTFLEVDEYGLIREEDLVEAITEQTILISMMMVNNEIGSTQDVASLIKAVRAKKKEVLIHVDAIQGFGKYRIHPKRIGIDLLSISGHKIHGPKGVGALFVRDKVKIRPIVFGGQQQKGMRSGTENVPGIAGLGQAVKEIYVDFDTKIAHLYELKQLLIDEVVKIPDVTVNGVKEEITETAPHVVSVSIAGIRSEVMLHALEEKGVFVSSGSACSSNHPALSGTLQAIGVKKELLDCTIRFSLCVYTTKEEIIYAVETLKEMVPMLRRFTRR